MSVYRYKGIKREKAPFFSWQLAVQKKALLCLVRELSAFSALLSQPSR